jgi:hypothetical protein
MLLQPLTERAVQAIGESGQVVTGSMQLATRPDRLGGYAQVGQRAVADAVQLALMPADTLTRLKGTVGPHKRVAWNEPLPLDDVKLVTGYAPLQVLAVTRSILRHLIQAVRAQPLAQAQNAGDGADREEEEGKRGCLRGSIWLRGCMSLLHPVKITSLAALGERAAFVRTQLAASVRQALVRQRSLVDHTQLDHTQLSRTCFEFFSSGTCKFEGRCKYKHGEHIRALCPGRATQQQKRTSASASRTAAPAPAPRPAAPAPAG